MDWTINGHRILERSAAEGRLINVRMVNALFEDDRPVEEKPEWDLDPERNTDLFIAQMSSYIAQGVRGFSIGLQGGFPVYRSQERRVVKECVSTCHSLWSQYN